MLGLGSNKNSNKPVDVSVSTKTVVRVALVIAVIYVILSILSQAQYVFTLIVIAFFLALALNGPVHWLTERLPGPKKSSRTWATSISFIVLVSLLIGFIISLVPPLVRQTNNFIDAVPGIVDDLHNQDSSVGKFITKHNLEDRVDKFSNQLSDRIDTLSGSLVGTIGKVTSSIFSMLAILVLTFMMLIEGPRWLDIFRRLTPKHNQEHVSNLTMQMYQVVRGFVNGQLLLAAIAAVFILVPLIILNVSYPVALMVIVFIAGLVPLVGHTIGAVIVSTIAAFSSVTAGIIILIYYITYQQVENYFVQPKIQATATNMSPLLVFAAVLIGASLNGLLGGLLAIPVAGCLRILVLDYVNRRNLMEPAEVKSETN